MSRKSLAAAGFAWLSACGGPAPSPPVSGAASAGAEASAPLAVEPEGQQRAGIEVVKAAITEAGDILEAPGQMVWNEDRTWSIGVVAAGKVLQTISRVGDIVQPGQVMARLHTHDVHDTRAFLRQAKTEQERAQAQVELAVRNRDRMKRLLELKAISQMQLDQAESEVRNAEAAVNRAKADVDRETQHLTEVLEIAAEDTGPPHVHAPGQYDESELVPIKSTAAGVVIDRKISVGSVCNLGQEAYIVADPESLWLLASFPERSLARLRAGQRVEILVQAYPGETFTGRILRLGDTLDRETRTLKVRIGVEARGKLKPEMFATVRLAGMAERVLTVPASAVQEIDGESTVFQQTAPGQFVPKKVEAEVRGSHALIRSGLQAGDPVAAKGSYFLKGRLVQEREGR